MALTGPAMLLKSFGLDPSVIQSKVDEAQNVLGQFVKQVGERFDKLDATAERIETNTIKILESTGDVAPAGENTPGFYDEILKGKNGHTGNCRSHTIETANG